MALARKRVDMPAQEDALPGRAAPIKVREVHFVNGHRIVPPFPAGLSEALFALGRRWIPVQALPLGAEELAERVSGRQADADPVGAQLLDRRRREILWLAYTHVR